jgi:Tn3 transposase DDE domain
MNPKADYGALNGLARQRINIPRITRNWDDQLRVAGSLKMGAVSASELIRGLQGGGRPSTLGRAIGELGRVAKTLYLLNYLDDEAYRRRILTQLNRGESRHAVARAILGYGNDSRQTGPLPSQILRIACEVEFAFCVLTRTRTRFHIPPLDSDSGRKLRRDTLLLLDHA